MVIFVGIGVIDGGTDVPTAIPVVAVTEDVADPT
jgi:hypothetical protein